MEEITSIISEISKIEERCKKIIQDANDEKKQLALESEQRTREFDECLQKDTLSQITDIRSKLEAQVADELEKQKAETVQCLQSLESEFDLNHEALAQNILNTIIGA